MWAVGNGDSKVSLDPKPEALKVLILSPLTINFFQIDPQTRNPTQIRNQQRLFCIPLRGNPLSSCQYRTSAVLSLARRHNVGA